MTACGRMSAAGSGGALLAGAASLAPILPVPVQVVRVDQVLPTRTDVRNVTSLDMSSDCHRRDVQTLGSLLDGQQLSHTSQDTDRCSAGNTLLDYTLTGAVYSSNVFFQ